MCRPKRAFTLIELLVVIAIIAILAAILFPVFAQARASARAISCLSNTKQSNLGVQMYAQDYDETFPQLDNNGACIYGNPICAQPDWGDAGPNTIRQGYMFWNVVQPYIKNNDLTYCPEAGRTQWPQAVAQAGTIFGNNWGTYEQAREPVYLGAVSQQAISIFVVNWWGLIPGYSRADNPNGQMAAINRPAEIVLTVGDSTWDTSSAPSLSIGNTGVWPYRPNTPCTTGLSASGPGWTWYVHRAAQRTGDPGAVPGRYDSGINSGLANVGFCDGHVKAMKYNNLERCDFHTTAGRWGWTYWDWRL